MLEAVRSGAERSAGAARRGRAWEDGPAGLCRRARGGLPRSSRRRGGVGDGASVRRPSPVVRAPARRSRAAARRRSATRWERPFGLSAGPAPDRFLVGLAVLSLVSDAAEQQPLVCLVDDAQWLDQCLGAGARVRSTAPAGGVGRRHVRGARAGPRPSWPGCRSCCSRGLPDADARELLASAITGPLDERVRRADHRRDAAATRSRCSSCRAGCRRRARRRIRR